MRITKVYTKIGDKGKTMLADGSKVPKTSSRIASYGDVDELNSVMAILYDQFRASGLGEQFDDILKSIRTIQNELFDLGGELATPLTVLDLSKQQVIQADQITRLEQDIDRLNADLKPLANFVLPGGHIVNSHAHLARTVCRRAERSFHELAGLEEVRGVLGIYLNRLSDWLFIVCRTLNHRLGIDEVLWQQNKP